MKAYGPSNPVNLSPEKDVGAVASGWASRPASRTPISRLLERASVFDPLVNTATVSTTAFFNASQAGQTKGPCP